MSRPSILVKEKTVWGKPTFYPVCDLSHLLCTLARTETLPTWMLRTIKGTKEEPGLFGVYEQLKGGYEIEWKEVSE
tara:strand:+ start:87 stop:314 length:228 start_codon:yes stop_codon:yes gene_type:complete